VLAERAAPSVAPLGVAGRTQANLSTDTVPTATASATQEADILRPDGTRIFVREENAEQVPGQERLTRPTTFFTAEGLIPFGMLFNF